MANPYAKGIEGNRGNTVPKDSTGKSSGYTTPSAVPSTPLASVNATVRNAKAKIHPAAVAAAGSHLAQMVSHVTDLTQSLKDPYASQYASEALGHLQNAQISHANGPANEALAGTRSEKFQQKEGGYNEAIGHVSNSFNSLNQLHQYLSESGNLNDSSNASLVTAANHARGYVAMAQPARVVRGNSVAVDSDYRAETDPVFAQKRQWEKNKEAAKKKKAAHLQKYKDA
jgi:hypothetical protein